MARRKNSKPVSEENTDDLQQEKGKVSSSTPSSGGVEESAPVESKRTTKSKLVNGKRVTPVTEQPASQRVEAPACPSCRVTRTHIYATRGRKRYCKCRRCGWTWGVAFGDVAAPVDNLQTR